MKNKNYNKEELIECLNHMDTLADIGAEEGEEKRELEKSYTTLYDFIINIDTPIKYCPRCIEPYEDDSKPSSGGNLVEGKKVESDCPECGVCKDCEHMADCKR